MLFGASPPWRLIGRQQMLFARLVIGHRMLKAAQRRSPKFHAIQILVQALEGFDQIANDHIFGRFRHRGGPLSVGLGHSAMLLEVKRLRAVWFPDCRRHARPNPRKRMEPFAAH